MNIKFLAFVKSYYSWDRVASSYIIASTVAVLCRASDSHLFGKAFFTLNTATQLFHVILITFWMLTSYFTVWAFFPYLTVKRFYKGYVHIRRWPLYRGYIWKPDELQNQKEYFENYPKDKEVIVSSAIRALNGDVYSVLKPGRHHHCLAMMYENHASELHVAGNTGDQGFMTNTNRYIGREEARTLALANGQAIYVHHPEELYSENLWNTPEDMKEPTEYEEDK